MKRIFALFLTLILIIGTLAACGGTQTTDDNDPTQAAQSSEKTELIVFAAASMTETLEQIAGLYKSAAPDVTLTFNFDSSGTLKTQIEEGSACDLFISAAQKQMNGLEEGGCIDPDTRIDLLENKVALCVADNSDKDIKSFDDMKAHLEAGDILMAVGNEDVPVGQYTQKIFTYYELDEAALNSKGVLTYGSRGRGRLRHNLSDRRLFGGYDRDRYRNKGNVRSGDLPRRRSEGEQKRRQGKGFSGVLTDKGSLRYLCGCRLHSLGGIISAFRFRTDIAKYFS